MKGRPPKHPALRQRRNRSVTNAELPPVDKAAVREVPPLPIRMDGALWHARVVEWWAAIWRSPMAAEWLEADMIGGLYLLAELHHQRWHATGKDVIAFAAEIRLHEVRFGLSPFDRHRLQWSVKSDRKGGDTAPKQGERAPRRPVKDPRSVLKVG